MATIKKERFKYINNAVVVSDLHAGCSFGLCPPEVQLDGGGTYQPKGAQRKIWEWWLEFWNEWVPDVIKGEPYCVIINGDALEGRHHNSTTQISQNLADQQKIAEMILRPIATKAEGGFYMIRGTEAHVGGAGENEEPLAKLLGAIPEPGDKGNFARYELWLRLGGPNGSLCHILHHIGTTGSQAFEGTALTKECTESLAEAARWGYPAPDFVIRSHRHRHYKCEFATRNKIGIGEITPGWQLKTPFTWKIPGGRVTTPQCGGILIRKGDREHYTVHKVFNVTRTPEVIAIETPTIRGSK